MNHHLINWKIFIQSSLKETFLFLVFLLKKCFLIFFFNVKLTCFHVFCYDLKNESENVFIVWLTWNSLLYFIISNNYMNKTFNNETCWENILIYIYIYINFLGASNRKTSPIFGIYMEKIMWRSNWFEQKRRKKEKEKKSMIGKVVHWRSVVCREKKRIGKLPLDSFYFVNHRICFPP